MGNSRIAPYLPSLLREGIEGWGATDPAARYERLPCRQSKGRRRRWHALLAALLAGLAPVVAPAQPAAQPATLSTRNGLYLGADLSYVNEMEDCGAVYRDSGGRQVDPFALMAARGGGPGTLSGVF